MYTIPVGNVGAVITTKNSQLTLYNCLSSIKLQTTKFSDVVIVDNYSKDKTLDIAASFGYKTISHGPERSHQRNIGVKNLQNCDYALIIDSDMILHQQLHEKIKQVLIEENFVGLFIPEIIIGKTFFTKVRNFERPYYDCTPIDAVRVISIKHFTDVNGYDANLFINGSGEDWDLDLKLKMKGSFGTLKREKSKSNISIKFAAENTDAKLKSIIGLFHDESKLTLIKFCTKKAYYSNTFNSYKMKWKGREEVNFQFSIINRLFKIFFSKTNYNSTLKNFHFYLYFLFYRSILIIYLTRYRLEKKIKSNDDVY